MRFSKQSVPPGDPPGLSQAAGSSVRPGTSEAVARRQKPAVKKLAAPTKVCAREQAQVASPRRAPVHNPSSASEARPHPARDLLRARSLSGLSGACESRTASLRALLVKSAERTKKLVSAVWSVIARAWLKGANAVATSWLGRGGDVLRFVSLWLSKPLSMGAIMPSASGLAELMASYVDATQPGYVVELGPGTGPVTKALVANGVEPERLVLVEFDEGLCALLRKRYPQAHVIQGDAYDLDRTLADFFRGDSGERGPGAAPLTDSTAAAAPGTLVAAGRPRVASVVSGLPLLTKPPAVREKLFRQIQGLLAPGGGGRFIQFTYGRKPPVKLTEELAAGATCTRSQRVWRNVPPAYVFVYHTTCDASETPRPARTANDPDGLGDGASDEGVDRAAAGGADDLGAPSRGEPDSCRSNAPSPASSQPVAVAARLAATPSTRVPQLAGTQLKPVAPPRATISQSVTTQEGSSHPEVVSSATSSARSSGSAVSSLEAKLGLTRTVAAPWLGSLSEPAGEDSCRPDTATIFRRIKSLRGRSDAEGAGTRTQTAAARAQSAGARTHSPGGRKRPLREREMREKRNVVGVPSLAAF